MLYCGCYTEYPHKVKPSFRFDHFYGFGGVFFFFFFTSNDFLSILINEQLSYRKCFGQFLAAPTLKQHAKVVSCNQKEYVITIFKGIILKL